MNKLPIKKLKKIFENCPSVKLAYIFGSRARGDADIKSDYDFAVYLDKKDSSKRFDIKLELMRIFSDLFKTDAVDVVILNDTDNPLLKFLVIKEGILLKEVEPYKLKLEPKILNEYFDYRLMYDKVFK